MEAMSWRELLEAMPELRLDGLKYFDGKVTGFGGRKVEFKPHWFLEPPAVEKDDTYCTDALSDATAHALCLARGVEILAKKRSELRQTAVYSHEPGANAYRDDMIAMIARGLLAGTDESIRAALTAIISPSPPPPATSAPGR